MFIYAYSVYHEKREEKCNSSLDEIVARAAYDIASNAASPLFVKREDGCIVLSEDALDKKAWEYIEKNNL